MKIGILQFDERINDENINEIINVNKNYAKIHGYDYIFKALQEEDLHRHAEEEEYLMNPTEKNKLRLNIYDYRIHMIEQYMNDYDYLVYLDTDMLINKPQIKIEDLIDNEHDMFLFTDSGKFNTTVGLIIVVNSIIAKCKETGVSYLQDPINELQNINNYGWSAYERLCSIIVSPNGLMSGFMIVKCGSSKLKPFINDFKRFYPLFENAWFDQGCMAVLLRRQKYKNMLKILPEKLHGNPFPDVPPGFGLDKENAFVCHFYGHNSQKKECKKYIEEIKANKWWNLINE